MARFDECASERCSKTVIRKRRDAKYCSDACMWHEAYMRKKNGTSDPKDIRYLGRKRARQRVAAEKAERFVSLYATDLMR